MTIEKINFSYPKGTLQSVYDAEEMTALELASKTSKKVDECVEMVNGVEQSAIEATAVVDEMRIAQDQFMTENNDIRQQLVIDNQTFIDGLEASQATFEGNMTTELNTFKDELNTSKTTFETDMTTELNTFKDELNTSKTTFETDMTTAVNTVISTSEATIEQDVNTKIDALIGDGTIESLINDTIIGGVNGRISEAELALNDATGNGVISGLTVLPQSSPDMTVLISTGVAHLFNGKRFSLLANANATVDAPDLYPRIDIIFINNAGVLTYGKGVASSSPIAPTPVNGLLLAEVSVLPSTTSITATNITDKRKIKTTMQDIEDKLNDFVLSQIINVKEFGVIGDGINDDTIAFKNALNYAILNRTPLLIDGKVLIKENIVFPNFGVTKIVGKNRDESQLLFDVPSGYAITIETYHNRPATFENLTIKNVGVGVKDGINVDATNVGYNWGVSTTMSSVNITGFTGVSLKHVDAFNCKYETVFIDGGKVNGANTGTLLKVIKGSTFSNLCSFKNVTFNNGKIGLQILMGALYQFDNCVFEFLDLFLHLPNPSGISPRISFTECWIEKVGKGILNCDINEATLTPIEPIANKGNLAFLRFTNNYDGGGVGQFTTLLNQIVEPQKYSYFNWYYGDTPPASYNPIFTPVYEVENGWSGTIEYNKDSFGRVTVRGKNITVGTTTAFTKVTSLTDGFKPNQLIPIMLVSVEVGNVHVDGNVLYMDNNGNVYVPYGKIAETYTEGTYSFEVSYMARL